MTLLIGFALRSTVLLALGLLLAACLAKRSAALRHRVLAASLLGAALVLPFNLTLPAWGVPLPAPVNDATVLLSPAVNLEGRSAQHDGHTARATSAAGAASAPSGSSTVSAVVVAWLAGVLFFAGLLISGLAHVRGIAARAAPVGDERWLGIRDAVAARYGVRRPIGIRRTESGELLATWGVLRPQVLLPRHAHDWPLDRVQIVLSHELAHIRRYDWPVQVAAELLRAFLWFNPLAWIVCTRLRRESEQACDDEVLGTGVGGRDYAVHLLDLARQCRRPGWTSALPMAHPSTLERRITAMLNPRLERRVPSRRVMTLLAALLLLAALPVGVLRARQAGPAPLTGTIYDVSGAVMPGVQVTLVGASEAPSQATSNAAGRFEFPPVAAGRYQLEARLAGFGTLRQEIELRSGADWERAILLQVGELRETITVRANRGLPPPQVESAAAGRVRVGGNVKPPQKIKDVRPVYPPSMLAAGLTGIVPLEATIGVDGSVSSIRVLSAQIHPDLAAAAVEAVRHWRFTPTLLNGQAVEVVMSVSVRFDLE